MTAKTYKYQLSETAYNKLAPMDRFSYELIHQYRESDPNIWLDCNIDDLENQRSYGYYIGRGWETRLVYRLKQI